MEALKAAARQRLAGGQDELDLGLEPRSPQAVARAGGPLPITSSRMGHLWDALAHAYDVLGFDAAAGGDEVFRQLVLARIIEPTSKLDSLRVLAEVGVHAAVLRHAQPSPARLRRDGWRQQAGRSLRGPHARWARRRLVLYDVWTLYFETDAGDGFREPGFSKERRLEPQITIGLLTDAAGFPLMVEAFEGNRAETTTMLPTIRAFMAAHRLRGRDRGGGRRDGLGGQPARDRGAGLSFILGARSPTSPTWCKWRRHHPDEPIPDGLVLTQPWPAGPNDHRRDQVIYYQYKHDRATCRRQPGG